MSDIVCVECCCATRCAASFCQPSKVQYKTLSIMGLTPLHKLKPYVPSRVNSAHHSYRTLVIVQKANELHGHVVKHWAQAVQSNSKIP